MCDPAGLALERMYAILMYRKSSIIFIFIYCLVFSLPVSADCGNIDRVHSIILLSSFSTLLIIICHSVLLSHKKKPTSIVWQKKTILVLLVLLYTKSRKKSKYVNMIGNKVCITSIYLKEYKLCLQHQLICLKLR